MNRRVLAAALTAAAILAAGCSGGASGNVTARETGGTRPAPVTSPSTIAPLPRVLMLGDSNLFQSGPEVEAALLDVGVVPTLLGVPGYGLKDLDTFWLAKLPGLLEADPEVVLVGLGTNDASDPRNLQRFPGRLDQMMTALGNRPVIWITHVDDRPGAPPTAGRAINAFIRDAVDRWPNLSVLDFAKTIREYPTVLRGDGLHFSPEGMHVYAREIAAATERRLRLSGLD